MRHFKSSIVIFCVYAAALGISTVLVHGRFLWGDFWLYLALLLLVSGFNALDAYRDRKQGRA